MTIWVDGDSCHGRAMETILAYSRDGRADVVVAADREIPGAAEAGAAMRVVRHGSGVVDDYIVEGCSPGDVAVTRDFGLGIRLVEAGVAILNDKGRIWTLEELRSRAADAEIMRAMRAGGIPKKRGATYGEADAVRFAESLSSLVGASAGR